LSIICVFSLVCWEKIISDFLLPINKHSFHFVEYVIELVATSVDADFAHIFFSHDAFSTYDHCYREE